MIFKGLSNPNYSMILWITILWVIFFVYSVKKKSCYCNLSQKNVLWPIVHGFPSLSPSPTAGIWGTQETKKLTGQGVKIHQSSMPKGWKIPILHISYQKQKKSLTPPLKSKQQFWHMNRKMEEAGSGHHPGIADLDRREQYSPCRLKGLPSSPSHYLLWVLFSIPTSAIQATLPTACEGKRDVYTVVGSWRHAVTKLYFYTLN